jgi:hypothetical protein
MSEGKSQLWSSVTVPLQNGTYYKQHMSIHEMWIQIHSPHVTQTHTMCSAAPSQTFHYFWHERSVKVQQIALCVYVCECLSAGWSEILFTSELRYLSLLQSLETRPEAHPVKLTIQLHLRLRFRMSAALPLLLLHVRTVTTVPSCTL